jgi:hypothetical protein
MILWLRSSQLTLRLIPRPHRIIFGVDPFWLTEGVGLGLLGPRDAICTPLFCVSSLFAPPSVLNLILIYFQLIQKSTYLANGLFKLFWLFWLC